MQFKHFEDMPAAAKSAEHTHTHNGLWTDTFCVPAEQLWTYIVIAI